MKRLLFFILVVSVFLSLPALAKRLTYGFRLAKTDLDFPHHPEWEVPLPPEMHAILQQPFHFIDKGTQSYVFESQDGNYVFKLFRYDQPPRGHKGILLFNACNMAYDSSRGHKVLLLFNACKMAYDLLREETGLIYIHLNPTVLGLPVFHCTDAVGRDVAFPLDHTRFAVQKKAKAFRAVLNEAKGNPIEMRKRLDQFVDLLQARTAKGIKNSDPSLSRNFGFLEERAVEFDFGSYRHLTDFDRVAEMKRYTFKLRLWLDRNAPEWISYLDERVANLQ